VNSTAAKCAAVVTGLPLSELQFGLNVELHELRKRLANRRRVGKQTK
jgi:hypothetical protein